MAPEEPVSSPPPQGGAVEDAQQSEGGDRSKPRSGAATVLAAAALVLALIALAGVGASSWAWYQLRGEQARVARLEGRVSALDGRVSMLAGSAAKATDVQALAKRLDTAERSGVERAKAFRGALHALATRLAGASIAYREDEAEALMRLAQARLDLSSDPAGAAAALQLADKALAATVEPELAPVRTELALEIQALKTVPEPDIDGAYARLGAIASRVDAFPLAESSLLPTLPKGTAPAPTLSWRGLGAALSRAFSPLVVVRHGPVARPLLPPREAYFVRENVKLALNGAQLALLERAPVAYRASIDRARHWLSGWFETTAPGVSQASSELQALASVDIAPKLPKLGAALAKLRALRAGAPAK